MFLKDLIPAKPISCRHSLSSLCSSRIRPNCQKRYTWTTCQSLVLRPNSHTKGQGGLLEVVAALNLHHYPLPLFRGTQVFSKSAFREKSSLIVTWVTRHVPRVVGSFSSSETRLMNCLELKSHANPERYGYGTQQLSPGSAQTAVEGLGSTFLVELSQGHRHGRDRYHAFQLQTPIAVRVCTF